MVSLPLVVLYLYFACGKDRCQVTFDPSIISLDWRDYFDLTAVKIFLGWFVFQAILAMLPLGRVSRKLKSFVYDKLSDNMWSEPAVRGTTPNCDFVLNLDSVWKR